MPLIEYKCDTCATCRDEIMSFPIPTELPCNQEGCKGVAYKQFSSHSQYKIKGNNSASVTPKKFRGEN